MHALGKHVVLLLLCLLFSNQVARGQDCTNAATAPRSFDGGCNNLQSITLGRIVTFYRRGPEGVVANALNTRPNARTGSVICDFAMGGRGKVNLPMNLLGTLFGQFIAHDTEATATTSQTLSAQAVLSNDPACSTNNGTRTCNPPAFGVAAGSGSVINGTKEVINDASAFLDMSIVYGLSQAQVNTLLVGANRCKFTTQTSVVSGVTLANTPPIDSTGSFVTGDGRANDNIALMCFQNLWILEHNRWCDLLASSIPDEATRFQEARKMTIAEYQQIVYNDYLSGELPEVYKRINKFVAYNSQLDPSVGYVFSHAGLRYGHSNLNPWRSVDAQGRVAGSDTPNMGMPQGRPIDALAAAGGCANVIRGLIETSPLPTDIGYSGVMWVGSGTGFDLWTQDVLRARDSSIPPYHIVRKAYRSTNQLVYGTSGCPASAETSSANDPIACFNAVTGSDSAQSNALSQTYGKVSKIDPMIGMMAEPALANNLIGETLTGVLTDGFGRLRDADRYWFENPGVLTADQLAQVHNTTFSQILMTNFGMLPTDPWQAPINAFMSNPPICNNNPCGTDATRNLCKPTVDGQNFTCTCTDGWVLNTTQSTGNEVCTADLTDDCKPAPCGTDPIRNQCTDTGFKSYTCNCTDGYVLGKNSAGKPMCTPDLTDDCKPLPCGSDSVRQRCTDTGFKNYTCSCTDGYVLGKNANGTQTCVPDLTDDCKNVSRCGTDLVNNVCWDVGFKDFECNCTGGWVSKALTNTSQVCVPDLTDDCKVNPCGNDPTRTVCTDTGVHTWNCSCTDGYVNALNLTNSKQQRCTPDLTDDCKPPFLCGPESNANVCEDTGFHNYTCHCNNGWITGSTAQGKSVCVNDPNDGCPANRCGPDPANDLCADAGVRLWQCTCQGGWTLPPAVNGSTTNLQCIPDLTDDCPTLPCGPEPANNLCTDIGVHDWTCVCKDGWVLGQDAQGKPTCVPDYTDDCTPLICGPDATNNVCKDTGVRSFACNCTGGYTLGSRTDSATNTTKPVCVVDYHDDCASNPCGPDKIRNVCLDQGLLSYSCICSGGYILGTRNDTVGYNGQSLQTCLEDPNVSILSDGRVVDKRDANRSNSGVLTSTTWGFSSLVLPGMLAMFIFRRFQN